MKPKRNFKKLLEEHKTIVFIGMVVIMFLSVGKIFLERNLKGNLDPKELTAEDLVKDKDLVPVPSVGINVLQLVSMYSDLQNADPNDTTMVKKIDKKLDKIISYEKN